MHQNCNRSNLLMIYFPSPSSLASGLWENKKFKKKLVMYLLETFSLSTRSSAGNVVHRSRRLLNILLIFLHYLNHGHPMLSRCSQTCRAMYVVIILFICSSELTCRGRKSASAERYEQGHGLAAHAGGTK